MRLIRARPLSLSKHRPLPVLAVLLLLAMASVAFATATGSVALPLAHLPQALLQVLGGRGDSLEATLVALRLGRALTAFVTGAALALAGVMMQALLRNPLADPYILGISGGAAVGALATMLWVSALWSIDLGAFAGAVAAALLLYGMARADLQGGASDGGDALLLTGIVISAGCMALVTLMLALAPQESLRGMVFWMMGDLGATPTRLLPWLVLAAGGAYALGAARGLNVVAMHGNAASALGVPVGRLRTGLFVCCALLTATAVSSAGSIGFVGLIVPHACRFALGPDHRLLLPAATLVGGAFLVLADTLARVVVAPQQLPVGVITALIGVPVFLVQLHHIRRR
jgi:iron complex transport system permease protein